MKKAAKPATPATEGKEALGFEEALKRLTAIVERLESGELSPDVDPRILSEMIYAPVYHRLLIGHRPLDDQLADDLIATALGFPAVAPRGRSSGKIRAAS